MILCTSIDSIIILLYLIQNMLAIFVVHVIVNEIIYSICYNIILQNNFFCDIFVISLISALNSYHSLHSKVKYNNVFQMIMQLSVMCSMQDVKFSVYYSIIVDDVIIIVM